MNNTKRMDSPARFVMLEKDNVRYEFFSVPVQKSNVDRTIAYYKPIVRYCKKLSGGSTYYDDEVTADGGNEFYKELIYKGYKKVTERSWA